MDSEEIDHLFEFLTNIENLLEKMVILLSEKQNLPVVEEVNVLYTTLESKYFYQVDPSSGGPWAVDDKKMEQDGWIFSAARSTGISYTIPSNGNHIHQVLEKIGKKDKDNRVITLRLEWYGGWNSGGEYWVEHR